jgi:Icc-related predicted phosphoesterase
MVADRVRVGAVADVHYGRETGSQLRAMFEHVAKRIDVLLLAGDLTDFGQPEEAAALTRDLTVLSGLPIIAILGNHDFEIGKDQEITSILRDAGIHVLDGDTCEVRGIGFVGVKGFGGGFGRGTLEPWGETAVKDFVRAAVDESL